MSHQIRQLKRNSASKFSTRTGKSCVPPGGAVLIKYARRALVRLNNARQAIEDSPQQPAAVHCGHYAHGGGEPGSQTLAYYCMENSDAHINIMTDTIKNIYDKLKSFETDLAIVGRKA